jgi:hypothetical protein
MLLILIIILFKFFNQQSGYSIKTGLNNNGSKQFQSFGASYIKEKIDSWGALYYLYRLLLVELQ